MKITKPKLFISMIGTFLLVLGLWIMEATLIATERKAKGEEYGLYTLFGFTRNLDLRWHIGIALVVISWFLLLYWIVWKD